MAAHSVNCKAARKGNVLVLVLIRWMILASLLVITKGNSYIATAAPWHSGHALDSLSLGPEFDPRRSNLILLTFLSNLPWYGHPTSGATQFYPHLLCLSNRTAPCSVDPETCLIKVILLKHGTDTGTFASASRAKDNWGGTSTAHGSAAQVYLIVVLCSW